MPIRLDSDPDWDGDTSLLEICGGENPPQTRPQYCPQGTPCSRRVPLSLQALFSLVLIVLQNSFPHLTKWQLPLQLGPKTLAFPPPHTHTPLFLSYPTSNLLMSPVTALQDQVPHLRGPGQNKNAGPLSQRYEEFQDGDSRAWNQVWGPLEQGRLCDIAGHMPVKLALILPAKTHLKSDHLSPSPQLASPKSTLCPFCPFSAQWPKQVGWHLSSLQNPPLAFHFTGSKSQSLYNGW